jgi:hypothetical protein
MKVKIVDKKEDVKEMTIEELAEREFIGLRGGSLKYMLAKVGRGMYRFVCAAYRLDFEGPKTEVLRQYVKNGEHNEGHTFDTARELYLWMAE